MSVGVAPLPHRRCPILTTDERAKVMFDSSVCVRMRRNCLGLFSRRVFSHVKYQNQEETLVTASVREQSGSLQSNRFTDGRGEFIVFRLFEHVKDLLLTGGLKSKKRFLYVFAHGDRAEHKET